MKNKEMLLSYLPKIFELKNAGLTYTEIVQELTDIKNIKVKDIYNLIYLVKTNNINKKFKFFTIMDGMNDAPELAKYCDFRYDLMISTEDIVKRFNATHLILTPDNFRKKCCSVKGLLYAKRLLRQYHIDDYQMIEEAKKYNVKLINNDLNLIINQIHNQLHNETDEIIKELKKCAVKLILH